jgi:hypothetical protein
MDRFLLLHLNSLFETNNGKNNKAEQMTNKKHTLRVCFLLDTMKYVDIGQNILDNHILPA